MTGKFYYINSITTAAEGPFDTREGAFTHGLSAAKRANAKDVRIIVLSKVDSMVVNDNFTGYKQVDE